MDWTGGYVADIGYTARFYRETAPSHLAFAALSLGRSPGRAFKPKKVLEIGFGQGFGLTLPDWLGELRLHDRERRQVNIVLPHGSIEVSQVRCAVGLLEAGRGEIAKHGPSGSPALAKASHCGAKSGLSNRRAPGPAHWRPRSRTTRLQPPRRTALLSIASEVSHLISRS